MRRSSFLAFLVGFLAVIALGFFCLARGQTRDAQVESAVRALYEMVQGKNEPANALKIEGVTEEVLPFVGKLVNHGSALFLDRTDYSELENFRYYQNGLGTRGGMTDYTTNVSPYGYPTTVGSALLYVDFESGTTAEGISYQNLCTTANVNYTGEGQGGDDHYIRVTSSDASTAKYVRSITTTQLTSGYAYQARVYVKNGSAPSQTIRISCYASGTEYFSAYHITTNSWQEVTLPFIAQVTSVHLIYIYWADDAASGETLLIDNFSVYRVQGQTERIIPFEETKTGHKYLISAGRNYGRTNWVYADFEDLSFPYAPIYQSDDATSKLSYAKVRDTLVVADGDDIWGWSGNDVYPAAIFERKTSTEYTDRYDWIYDGQPHNCDENSTIFVGYTRAFNQATLDGINTVSASPTLAYLGGKFLYWQSLGATSDNLLDDPGFDTACGAGTWVCSGTTPSVWTISGSSAHLDGSQTTYTYLHQDISDYAKQGYFYKTVFTVSSYIAGNVRVRVGNNKAGTWRSANGTYTEFITASATENAIYFYLEADDAFSGNVDNVQCASFTIHNPSIGTDQTVITGNLWDGFDWMYAQDAIFQLSSTSAEYRDYSYWVRNSSTETYMDISKMESTGTIYLSFPYKAWAIKLWLPELNKNTAASTLSAKYWDGNSWETLSITDGTSNGSATMAQTGMITFTVPTDWEARTYGQSTFSGYPILLSTSATLDNYVRIFKVTAIPYPDSINDEAWKMVGSYRNRLVLANGYDKALLRVSAENQPDTFVGPDSCYVQVGEREDTIGLADLKDGLLVMKTTANYFITGVNPETFHVEPLKGTAPNVAPYSLVTIERDTGSYAIYQGPDGFYAIFPDGKNAKISTDIKAYWENGNSLAITSGWLDDTQGWYDKNNEEYHALIASGSGTTQYNVELVYNIPMNKWSTFNRNNNIELSTGVGFTDSNNNYVTLGASYNGVVYYLERGTTDDGYAISSVVTRKPINLSGGIGKRELVGTAIYYDLISDESTTGTFTLTNGISASSTSTASNYTLTDEGFYFHFLRGPVYKGHYVIPKWAFTERIFLYNEAFWSREAEWSKD